MTRQRLVGLSANVQRPSKTRTLVDAVLREAGARAPLARRLPLAKIFFNDTAITVIYTLSLPDALPIR